MITLKPRAAIALNIATTGIPSKAYAPRIIAIQGRLVTHKGIPLPERGGWFRVYVRPQHESTLRDSQATKAQAFHKIPPDEVMSRGLPFTEALQAVETWREKMRTAVRNNGTPWAGAWLYNVEFADKVLRAYKCSAQALGVGDCLMTTYGSIMANAGANSRLNDGSPRNIARKKALLWATAQPAAHNVLQGGFLDGTLESCNKGDANLLRVLPLVGGDASDPALPRGFAEDDHTRHYDEVAL